MDPLRDELIDMAEKVDEFQREILALPYRVGLLPEHRQKFREGHLEEELQEIKDAYAAGDYAGVIDGLVDISYLAQGALLEMGAEPMFCFMPVHRANMGKIRGVTKRGEAFDAVKPEGWEPPDMNAVYERFKLFEAISPAFLEATRIKLERGAKYNQGSVQRKDHFPLGSAGHMQMHWIKSIRLLSEIQGCLATGKPVDTEQLSEHLRDGMNYDSFWWEELNGGIRP